ncbi:hypothetical protein AWB91_09030 [Mycobacterium paraense]|uniref:Uncharacterized protein n=1 Tax=Mycobacterium paraense TaxID=767916 RepID=A0ABX3VS17_9MYCO|nr:hypothetical protein [Mycobacterium paraense]ORW33259.1 hypothetical protein AWB91_09030 [Mycobacterium paraense]ORW34680.1 hypothetical protein AWB88_02745 [Mycobacterium paraense]
MQHKTYPLPPLLLTPIIERCREDHTYHPHPEGDIDGPEWEEYRAAGSCDMEPVVVDIREGNGRHECDADCRITWAGCLGSCSDSDWVVELRYHSQGYRATYGITRAGDVQRVVLWCD